MKRAFSLFAATVILVIIAFIPRIVPIYEVRCSGQFGQCNPELNSSIEAISLTNYQQTRSRVVDALEASSDVSEYSVKFIFPSKFEIVVVHDKQSFAIWNKDLNLYALVNNSGDVLSLVDETNLPSMSTSQKLPAVGEFVGQETLFALDVVGRLNTYIKYAELRDNDLQVRTNDEFKVIFPLVGDKEILLGSFILIMSRLQEGGEELRIENIGEVSEIDLRFKNPVLR